jgi:SNF2 family DNA or RNA helicase
MDPSLCCKWTNLQNLLAHWRPNHETNGNKVLIFSMSVKLLKIIEFFIQGEGHKYKFLHGQYFL